VSLRRQPLRYQPLLLPASAALGLCSGWPPRLPLLQPAYAAALLCCYQPLLQLDSAAAGLCCSRHPQQLASAAAVLCLCRPLLQPAYCSGLCCCHPLQRPASVAAILYSSPLLPSPSAAAGLYCSKPLLLSASATAAGLCCCRPPQPWNFSIAAIEGFLHTTKFGGRIFRSPRELVKQLSAFVDLCLEENARPGNLRKPFLGNTELTNEWNVFTAASGAAAGSAPGGQKRGRSPNRNRSPQRRNWQPEEPRLCYRCNDGTCRSKEDCIDSNGERLRHLRSVRSGKAGGRCAKRHPAKYHR